MKSQERILTFNEYLNKLNEAINLNNKPFPKFGNILILAGGAGSGKGFVLEKLVNFEGFTYNVDDLKSLGVTLGLFDKYLEDQGIPENERDMSNPEVTALIHRYVKETKLDKRWENRIFTSVLNSHPDRKPNIIYDVTLKELEKFQHIIEQAEVLGYESKNIHIVYVINSIDNALVNNATRKRSVPKDILVQTNRGSFETLNHIMNNLLDFGRMFDGDIWIAFNNQSEDDITLRRSDKGGEYIDRKDITDSVFRIKQAGKRIDISKFNDYIKNKIDRYMQ